MAGLKELLKKKEKISENHAPLPAAVQPPEFKFIRTTTDLHDTIEAPDFPDQPEPGVDEYKKKENRLTASFRRSLHLGSSNDGSGYDSHKSARPKNERRLSERLHLASSRSASRSPEPSAHVPSDLPDAPAYVLSSVGDKEEPQVRDQREAQWEKRATILAQSNPLAGVVGVGEPTTERGRVSKEPRERSATRSRSISNARGDENIQEAIRLHELGELTLSTAMFGRLADPARENIALAQVLYGLALRHGWGVPVEAAKAIHYLSLAAANSANIEEQALASGMKRGGAAKGELVLAMFELANCFRHGWGVKCDPTAARQYYETAANLGDTDAMEEAAWCYLEGFGGPKDKFKAAQYLRLAEKQGSRAVGNSWIWKDKYNP